MSKSAAPRSPLTLGEGVDLSNTVGTFASRMARKLRAQEAVEKEAAKATDQRHKLILQAMSSVRRALQETMKISMGSRFSFEMHIADFEGWPRIELSLWDNLANSPTENLLTVSADDHSQAGTVRITFNHDELVGLVCLKDPAEMNKLPIILKKAVRDFLERVSTYVLNPAKPEELLEYQSRNIEEESMDPLSSELKKQELFTESVSAGNDNVIDSLTDDVQPVKL
jgi:hypothetical protein